MECQVKSEPNMIPIASWILIGIGGIFVLVIFLLELVLLPKRRNLDNASKSELLSHAVVTGGSSGIGLAIARQLIFQKCKHVTLLARDEKKLNQAMENLKEYAESIGSGCSTNIRIHPVNVSNVEMIVKVAKDLSSSEEYPAPTMLFNVAGTSSSAAFVDTDYKEFHRLVDINYLGSAYTTRAFLPHMIPKVSTAKEYHPRAIVFTSSQAGQLGVYGYTAYSASKYALRGLAEALQMEVGRDNISVQVAFPPDTDTPGFEEEQIGKPEETKLISQTSGLFSADCVAKKIVLSTLQRRPPFLIYFGLEGWMLSSLTAGMSPVHNMVDALCQIFLSGLFRLISLFYLFDFRNIVNRVGKNNQKAAQVGDRAE
mmetsp:Transcript_11122/g.20814  ORF Transcript_11122/g.20814 Transcript_11122/m.20814 type:complete len:370 (+) Transcript_11122:94-1203(+)|eukprot:CAMPEP_0176487268 /NCGR_PEP_ID=MMETSP0200_2-20121128/6031_1 /TAXON_ID=947934 /ORGANISM="Chaetoceros sp., Strain GSL56" /LENGTH=369 /DNA_ID=CAMNT_0017884065 /DNA_START=50 /DNA_END=1159 /DNA_ORIENTATION=-